MAEKRFKVCPECQTRNEVTNDFCVNCGTSLKDVFFTVSQKTEVEDVNGNEPEDESDSDDLKFTTNEILVGWSQYLVIGLIAYSISSHLLVAWAVIGIIFAIIFMYLGEWKSALIYIFVGLPVSLVIIYYLRIMWVSPFLNTY